MLAYAAVESTRSAATWCAASFEDTASGCLQKSCLLPAFSCRFPPYPPLVGGRWQHEITGDLQGVPRPDAFRSPARPLTFSLSKATCNDNFNGNLMICRFPPYPLFVGGR